MANNINVKLTVNDNATTSLRRVQSEVTNFANNTENQFKKMAKTAMASLGGLFAYNSIKSFANESINAYKIQLNAESKLTAAIGYKSKALERYASELQSVTTYGDEIIIQAQAMIAPFVKEESQIKKVTKAAMELATAKNMDLVSAADLVTKSISSSTNTLKRYGIDIEGAQGSTERLDSAVNAITKAFGGMSEAMAKTDVGKLEQMKNITGDIKETIGKEIIPLQLEWNRVVLLGVKGLSSMLTYYTKAAGIAGSLIGGKSLEGVRVDRTIEEASGMDQEKAKNYLFEQRAKKLDEIKTQEALIAKQREHLDYMKADAHYSKKIKLLQQSEEIISKESQKLYELQYHAKQYADALRGVVDKPEETPKLTTSGSDITGKQSVNILGWFDKVKADSYKDAEVQYNKRIELNKQFEKMATDASEADVKARWEKRVETEKMYQQLRIDTIKDPIQKELELHKLKYSELESMASGNADAILNIQKAKALDEARIEEFKKKTMQDNMKAGLDSTVNNLNQMASQWKVFGGLYKTAAVTQTIIDTYSGAQAAFKSLAGIPIVGAALGGVAAGAAIAGGLARVAMIKKQKFASGTIYAPGGWSTVGENGPEDMYIPGGAMIVNNRESKHYNNSSSRSVTNNNGTTMNVTLVDNSGSIAKQMSTRIRDGAEDELVRMLTQRASRIMR